VKPDSAIQLESSLQSWFLGSDCMRSVSTRFQFCIGLFYWREIMPALKHTDYLLIANILLDMKGIELHGVEGGGGIPTVYYPLDPGALAARIHQAVYNKVVGD